jgi:hypothetical protein
VAAADLLATDLDAEHVTKTNSGQEMYLYSPALVIDAVREVVDDARAGRAHPRGKPRPALLPSIAAEAGRTRQLTGGGGVLTISDPLLTVVRKRQSVRDS